MKREIHWYCYPGGLQVSIVITTEEGEKWQPMQIIPVAFLPSPMRSPCGEWQRRSEELTNEERLTIECQARSCLKDWVRWSLNPNREKAFERGLEERTEAMMQRVPIDYKIQKYKGYEDYER